MALVYSMYFEDIENSGGFVKRIIDASLFSKVSLVPYSRENLLLAIILIYGIFLLHDFLCIVHTLVYLAKDIS